MDLLAFIMALKAQGMTAAQITAAVNEYLQDHPDALDQAAVEAILDGRLDVIDNELSSVKSVIAYTNGIEPIPMVSNKYISLSGSTVSMTSGHPAYSSGSTTYSCGYIECSAGDYFIISGKGGSSTRAWGFVDSEGNILCACAENVTYTELILIAPEDAAWIIVHTNDGKQSYKGKAYTVLGDTIFNQCYSISRFEQGAISGTDGHIIDSTTRIHTTDLIKYEQGMYVCFNKSLKVAYRYFNNISECIGGDTEWRTGATFVPPINGTYYIGLNIAYSDDSTITPSDNITVQVIKQQKRITDDTLTENGKAADAKATGDMIRNAVGASTPSSSMLGNMSIRAAKTINFSDGTPPVIDWYLLQSVDAKFYKSKDLVSKEYLFTTAGSGMTGYISDWSAGITPNNDVIFVSDAARLSTSVNGRLSDDNRINPIVFLASENYSTAHIIDFGSSLKPCGWLNNVGFCTLPNGDIVFAEYTRGTVKTANVWLISGDITDPSNWSVTWSVDIIDTMDSTTSGTKHCHEVMYDFYTGVLYFGTGDSETGSNNYYSTDGGENWNLLYGEDKNRCRRLNFIFTEDYVYWASDSWQTDDHHFFIGERDNDGLVDVENATEVTLTSGNGQACYGCVYLKEQNLIVMMDRIDDPVTKKLNWYCYDLTTETVEKIGEIGSADDTLTFLGFRCRFMDFYPTGNAILTGFSPRATSANPDTNCNKLCGNQGGTTGNGSTRINNLLMYVYKNGTNYSYRAKTLWI